MSTLALTNCAAAGEVRSPQFLLQLNSKRPPHQNRNQTRVERKYMKTQTLVTHLITPSCTPTFPDPIGIRGTLTDTSPPSSTKMLGMTVAQMQEVVLPIRTFSTLAEVIEESTDYIICLCIMFYYTFVMK